LENRIKRNTNNLKSEAKKKAKESTIRFVPTAKKVYGVKAGI